MLRQITRSLLGLGAAILMAAPGPSEAAEEAVERSGVERRYVVDRSIFMAPAKKDAASRKTEEETLLTLLEGQTPGQREQLKADGLKTPEMGFERLLRNLEDVRDIQDRPSGGSGLTASSGLGPAPSGPGTSGPSGGVGPGPTGSGGPPTGPPSPPPVRVDPADQGKGGGGKGSDVAD